MAHTIEATQFYKGSNGWNAKTRVRFNDTIKTSSGKDGQRCLTLRTYKTDRGMLATYASASVIADRMESFLLVGDFSKTAMSIPAKRVLEKDVRAQHAQVILEQLPGLIGEMETFYANKSAKAA